VGLVARGNAEPSAAIWNSGERDSNRVEPDLHWLTLVINEWYMSIKDLSDN
jgi:hypothetical protein